MAKKKLLSESQVRRFMGLAGMQPISVSNVIQEMGYMEKDEDPADAEAPPAMDDMSEPADMEMDADMEPAGGEEMDMEDGDLDLEPSDIKKAFQGMQDAMELMSQLNDAVGEEDMEAGDMEPAELEEPAAEEPEAEMDAELSEVDLQLSEEEIVQEVARRVAKRIIKAKRAKKVLDEALGRK